MPGTVLVSTIAGNIAGLLLAGIFQSTYIATTQQLNHTLWDQLGYSFGAGIFVASVAVPFSIVLMIVVTLVSWRFTRWHLALGTAFGLYFGIGALGSIYWGIPVLTYSLGTAICSCWLVLRRQQQMLSDA